MPATQQGQTYKLGKGRFGLRYYDDQGTRHRKSPFPSASAARKHYRDVIEPQLRGELATRPDETFSDFVRVYLARHEANVRPRTIATLRERLRHAERRREGTGDNRREVPVFSNVPLRELERMTDEIAAWATKQPPGARHGRVQALRQVLGAAVRWGYITRNPAVEMGRNRQPSPRTIRAFTLAELEALSVELSPQYQSLPMFAATTGLRPEEWQALERRDIDRRAGCLNVRRTVSSHEVVELGKTSRSRRQVPLSPRALAALDALPPRLDTPLLFPSPTGTLLHIDNFRYREWTPAVVACGMARPARIYDLRSTFASNALAAGIAVFELSKVMGTSVEMLERHYGSLLDGAGASIASRLAAWEDTQVRGTEAL